jgi:hypothetical protein
MHVTTRSDDELRKLSERKLLSPDIYDARILAAQENESKAGRPMAVFVVGLRDIEGIERELTDYLTDSAANAARLHSLVNACDLLSGYAAGELDVREFVGKSVRCRVSTEKGKGAYRPRNRIDEYMPATAVSVVPLRAAE